MMSNELLEIRSNDIIMESLHDIAMDLPAGERSKYCDIVTEAIVNRPEVQMKIISKLSKQVDNLQQVDLEQCRKSMGNITKYPYYDALNKAIEIINESEVTSDLENVMRMNKIHNILLDNADDFIWGFKHNDMVITKAYILLTRLLFIMVDLSISDYVKKLEISFKYNAKMDKTPTKISRVINDADKMIRIFEKGDWRMVMTSAKKSATNRNMRAIDEMNGTEPPESMASEAIKIPFYNSDTKELNVPSTSDETKKGFEKWWTSIGKGGHAAIIVTTVVIMILIFYRDIAFAVAALGGRFANCVRHWAELIKANDNANRSQSDSAVEKHQKVYDRMIGIADRIDAFFTKASNEAEIKIKNANREDFNTAEINQIEGIDFGL